MRLSDDLREAMRTALMLTVEQGDPEDEESPEERAARDAQILAAVAWLDTPGIKLSVEAADYQRITSAVTYTAEDYSYRAGYEDQTGGDPGERDGYQEAADEYSNLADRLEEGKA